MKVGGPFDQELREAIINYYTEKQENKWNGSCP